MPTTKEPELSLLDNPNNEISWSNLLKLKNQLDSNNTLPRIRDEYISVIRTHVMTMGSIINAPPGVLQVDVNQINRDVENTINKPLKQYDALITRMIKEIGNRRKNVVDGPIDLATKKKAEYAELDAEVKQLKADLATHRARKEAVERATKDASYEQLFGGISRPIRAQSIPIILALSVIFFMVGIYVIYRIMALPGPGANMVSLIQQGGSNILRHVKNARLK